MKLAHPFEQTSPKALLHLQSFQDVPHSLFEGPRSVLIPKDFPTLQKTWGVQPLKANRKRKSFGFGLIRLRQAAASERLHLPEVLSGTSDWVLRVIEYGTFGDPVKIGAGCRALTGDQS